MSERSRTFRLRIDVDTKIYALLQKVVGKTGYEDTAIQTAIERGMERYWDHWFDEQATHFELEKKRYEECQRDNKLLRDLIDQNEKLRQLTETSKESS